MKIDTRAASMPIQEHTLHAMPHTPDSKPNQTAPADNNPFRMPQPDPLPEGYGKTVGASADYYADNKTMKAERMWDADGHQVNYDFDENGKRTHELDLTLKGDKIDISGPSYDFDKDGNRVPVDGAHKYY
jgi:hypothetical protein